MSLTTLHIGMIGESGIGITSLIALFEYNRLPTSYLPRYSGLGDVILPASLPSFSRYPSSYPSEFEWRDWRWYRHVPISLNEWLKIEQRSNTRRREIVQIHQLELDLAGSPSTRDHYRGFDAIAICFSVIDRKSFNMVMEKVSNLLPSSSQRALIPAPIYLVASGDPSFSTEIASTFSRHKVRLTG